MLQNGDGRAIGVPVRKALLKLSGVILAQQINPLTQKTPIGEAEHCLSNYRGSLQNWEAVQSYWGLCVSSVRCDTLRYSADGNSTLQNYLSATPTQ